MQNAAYELRIDPALWRGGDFRTRLIGHFADIVPWDAFLMFVADRRETDPSASVAGMRRIYDRRGGPVLVALVTWREKASQWRFPLQAWLVDPETQHRYLVFEARLKRIGLDVGYAMQDEVYYDLAGVNE